MKSSTAYLLTLLVAQLWFCSIPVDSQDPRHGGHGRDLITKRLEAAGWSTDSENLRLLVLDTGADLGLRRAALTLLHRHDLEGHKDLYLRLLTDRDPTLVRRAASRLAFAGLDEGIDRLRSLAATEGPERVYAATSLVDLELLDGAQSLLQAGRSRVAKSRSQACMALASAVRKAANTNQPEWRDALGEMVQLLEQIASKDPELWIRPQAVFALVDAQDAAPEQVGAALSRLRPLFQEHLRVMKKIEGALRNLGLSNIEEES